MDLIVLSKRVISYQLFYHRNSSKTISGRAPRRRAIIEVPMPRETYKSPQAVW
jgi:hypothetical protein